MSNKTVEGSNEWFLEHGITPEIAAARPYVRYTVDNHQAVKDAYRDLNRDQRGYMTRLAKQANGLVITRHAPPGLGLSHVYAELRPDWPVKTGPGIWHYHATEFDGNVPIYPQSGKPLLEKHIHSAKAMTKHIARAKSEDDHNGANNENVHMHQPRAKYLFPPSATKEVSWYHNHADMKPEKRAVHVERYGDEIGRHRHSRKVKDKSKSLAKRIDVHPLALPLFEKAERVFFGIEGCLKADAILSQGEAVFSVPSVTLWDALELEEFVLRYLWGKTVIIVPDMDWHGNPAVITQAFLCRSFLRRFDYLKAHIAAPPHEAGYKGVDDFLGAGGSLDDLVVIDRETPFDLIEFTVKTNGRVIGGSRSRRVDRIRRDTEVLESLAIHADTEGVFQSPLRTAARIMDVDVKRVARSVTALEEIGAIEIDGRLNTRRGYWSGQLEWNNAPRIIIRQDIRARDLPPRRLHEVFTQSDTMKETDMPAELMMDNREVTHRLDAIARQLDESMREVVLVAERIRARLPESERDNLDNVIPLLQRTGI